MYNHGVLVAELAPQLAGGDCDPLVVKIGALLHDIGKVHAADKETLMREHEKFGLIVAGEFVKSLGLNDAQVKALEKILSGDFSGAEGRAIKAADGAAFFIDEELQAAFQRWALRENKPSELTRKLAKFDKLDSAARQMARAGYEKLAKKWAKT